MSDSRQQPGTSAAGVLPGPPGRSACAATGRCARGGSGVATTAPTRLAAAARQPQSPTQPAAGGRQLAARTQIASESANPLGAFLRARRELVTPQQAGIAAIGRRRVPGLRREEVAQLAGISVDYYLRLERGRDRHPSRSVLDAIARVLLLDDDHRKHLHGLSNPTARMAQQPAGGIAPPDGAVALLHTLTLPAFIEDHMFTIAASNAAARALSPRLVAGRNRLRDLLFDANEQALYPDWISMTKCLVASLRQLVGQDVGDSRLIDLITELSEGSPHFGRLWARHDVLSQHGVPVRIDHPTLGRISPHRERLAIAGARDMEFVVYHPVQPGDVDKLALLAPG